MKGIDMKKNRELTLPAGESVVEALRYAGNLEIASVTVPEGVEILGAKAFSQCRELRTLQLPGSLTHIEMKCFEGCPLEDIFYRGSANQWMQLEISPQGSGSIITARKHFSEGGPAGPVVCRENRGEELLERIRSLLVAGGDGRLHIVAPGLCVEGVLTKPGDMTLLIFPEGATMLIDTGHAANLGRVMEFLRGIGLTHLDYMAFSHADADHVSNAQAIGDYLYSEQGGVIRNFWWTGQRFGEIVPAFIDFLRARDVQLDLRVLAGRRFWIQGVEVQILGPTEEELRLDPRDQDIRNSQSMMMRFAFGAASYLTCGDLYAAQEAAAVKRCGQALRADISKTNHHGCFTSNSSIWLDAVGGRLMFSSGNDNGSTLLARELHSRGVTYLSTGCQGTLLISASAEGAYETDTQYNGELRCIQRIN